MVKIFNKTDLDVTAQVCVETSFVECILISFSNTYYYYAYFSKAGLA